MITACTQIDVAGLDRTNVDTFVARWQGTPCVASLSTGNPWQACEFGEPVAVCQKSAGLTLLGCSCVDSKLSCVNGKKLGEDAEAVSCGRDGGADK